MRGAILRFTAGVLLTLFATSSVFALDGGTIDRWVDAMEELQAWGNDEATDMDHDFGGEMENPMDFDFGAMLEQSAREHSKVRSIVRKHGFTPEEWADAGSRIFEAYIAIQMEGASAEMDKEMARAMREMEDNPHMSEAHKEQMRQQMRQAKQTMGGMGKDVPASDRRAVESRRDRLDSFFDADDE